MRIIAILSIFSIIGALASGCAKGPAGGPVVPAPNRMTVSMTLQQPVNQQFFYAFAFDDDNDRSDGPRAIIGSTLAPNGLVGGAFTVLVQYRGGQWLAFRRTDLGNGQERLERSTNAFVTAPIAGGNNLQFTLNLDATVDDQTVPNRRLFVEDLQNLDVNFVTSSEISRSTENFVNKPFDAFYESRGGTGGVGGSDLYFSFGAAGTRIIRNTDTVREPTGDVYVPPGHPISEQQRTQLDITDFTINVQRSNPQ